MPEGFSLADAIKGAVSDSDTSRRQITNIDIDALIDDPNNFYELSGLDELAANIETVGLQQPLLVRPAAEAGQYIIVSGHRRRAAIRKLVDDGRDDLRLIPCIVDSWEGSEAMRELRLIYANADTRRMTSAEISKQAERVELLLYQLQKEGYSFPGRMRDHVAEACKVSRTKLARLKVIREKLIPELREVWERGEMNEAVAYACAQQPEDIQRKLLEYSKECAYYTTPDRWYESTVDIRVKWITNERALTCGCFGYEGTPCLNTWNRLACLGKENACYGDNCRSGLCCAGCQRLATCTFSCHRLEKDVQALKAKAKQERAANKQKADKLSAAKIEAITRIWDRFGKARAAAGKSVKACCDAMEVCYFTDRDTDYAAQEAGQDIKPDTGLPFGYRIDLDDINKLNDAADLLGCSVDYLLGRDVPATPAQPDGQLVINGWMPGSTNPGPKKGDVVAVFDMGDGNPPLRIICWWNGEDYRIGRGGAPINERCVRWMRLPPEPEGVQGDE